MTPLRNSSPVSRLNNNGKAVLHWCQKHRYNLTSHCEWHWQNVSDTEPLWYWTYQIPNLSDTEPIRYWIYQNISDSGPIRNQTYQTLNISDTELVTHWTYRIPNLACTKPILDPSDTKPVRYTVPIRQNLSDDELDRYQAMSPPIQILRWLLTPSTVEHPVVKLGLKQVLPSPISRSQLTSPSKPPSMPSQPPLPLPVHNERQPFPACHCSPLSPSQLTMTTNPSQYTLWQNWGGKRYTAVPSPPPRHILLTCRVHCPKYILEIQG
jgi:hypothetical protein